MKVLGALPHCQTMAATMKVWDGLLVGLLVPQQPLLLAETYASVGLLVLLVVLMLLALSAGCCC